MRVFKIIPSFLQHTLWLLLRLCRPFVRRYPYFSGAENLRLTDKTGTIFAVNHVTHSDPVLIPLGFPFWSAHFPLYYVSRPKGGYNHLGLIGRYFYGGELFKLWGAYPAYKGLGDLEKALLWHTEILKQKKSLLIFPEAGIPKHEDTALARPGIAYLAQRSGIPITPVYIEKGKRMHVRYGTPFTISEITVPPELPQGSQEHHKYIAQEILSRVYALKNPQ